VVELLGALVKVLGGRTVVPRVAAMPIFGAAFRGGFSA